MKATVFPLTALACSSCDAFISSTASLRPPAGALSRARVATSSPSSLKMKLNEDDFIPSEEWLGEYMGQQGLRYALNKTPEEIEREGDYTILEKLFGQTSNNKARMDLKQQVLAKAGIPTDPVRYKEWTAKYGYGRFFPVYVDKSGNNDDDSSPNPAAAIKSAAKKAAPSSNPFAGLMAKASSAASTASTKTAKATSKAGDTAAKVGAKASAKAGPFAAKAVKAAKSGAVAAKKAAPKVEREAKKLASAKPAPKKAAPSPPKPMGNIKNLPKAL